MEFNSILRRRGISSQIINAPQNISSSCTLSIKTELRYYAEISTLIKTLKIEGFIGLFMVEKYGIREQTQRLY